MQKLAVIGGGPAGLSAALQGARQGMQVELFERGAIGGRISCGEVVFNIFKLVSQPREIRYSPEVMFFKGEKVHPLHVGHVDIWSVDRSHWQKSLGEQAVSLGVKITRGRVGAGDLPGMQKDFDFIVDAAGISSPTAALFGFRQAQRQGAGKALQYAVEGDFSSLGPNLVIGIRPHFIGYYWIFPTGSGEDWSAANVGVGYFSTPGYEDLDLVQEIEEVMALEGLHGYRVVKKCGGLIPTRALQKLDYENILLAGDAAGLASPLHAGGMDTALVSGALAVRCIGAGNTGEYRDLLMGKIGRKMAAERDMLNLWQNIGYEGINLFFAAVLEGRERAKFYSLFLNRKKDFWQYYRSLAFYLKHLLGDQRAWLPEPEDLSLNPAK